MKKILILLVVVVIALCAWLMQDTATDEDQVRAAIQQVADGSEAADLVMCMESFSSRYADPEGLDRRSIQGILWQQFRKRGPISVWLGAIHVEVEGDQASADFDVALTEGSSGGAWPVSADALTFEVQLAREEDGWRIISHTRRPVLSVKDTGRKRSPR